MSRFSRLKNVLRPRQLDESIEDEIRDHLARRADAFRREGVPPDEARRRAETVFGSLARVREQSREIRRSALLDTTVQDLQYAWRTMRRSPTFTLAALLSLSLAIAANTAIYAVVDAAMLRPLPVPDAARVFSIAAPALEPASASALGETDTFSYPLYLQLRHAAGDAARIVLFGPTERSEAQGPDPSSPVVRINQQFVSADALAGLGVTPAAGRLFSGDDDRGPGGAPTAVLGYDYWQRQLGGSPAVIGQSLVLANRRFRIIGVAAKGFSGVEPGRFVDAWIPVSMFDPGAFSNPDAALFRLVGRLAAAATREQLDARLQPVFRRRQQEVIARHPEFSAAALRAYGERGLRLRTGGVGTSEFQRTFARPMWIVWSVAAVMLLAACANVAGLLLARSVSRVPEMSVRRSLGASRRRLARQLLTESLVLTTAASVLGWIGASLGAPVLVAALSTDANPVRLAVTMDVRVLLFSIAICAATTLAAGLVPAWYGAGPRTLSLAVRRLDPGRARFGRLFMSLQVAVVFWLVVAAIGFDVSLHKLSAIDAGFDPRHVTVLTLRSDLSPRPEGLTVTHELRRRVGSLPHVDGAAVAWWTLFGDARRSDRILIERGSPSEREEIFYRVSPGYFATLRTPLLAGRDFDLHDTDGATPIPTIVNRAFARRYFGSETVLGREFTRAADGARHLIIGLAADAYYSDLHGGLQPIVYFPMKPPRLFSLYVRSTLDAASVRQLVEREAVAAAGANLHVVDVTTLERAIASTLVKEQLLAGLGSAFAALGLGLVGIGVFGLLNYSVTRRTKEIGIRAALGARRQALIALVLKELSGIMAGGLSIGVLGALLLMRLVRSYLYGIAAVDPTVMLAAAAAFIVATAVAVVLPAYRVATTDPNVALRVD